MNVHADIVILGYRHGLGPALKDALMSNLAVTYIPLIDLKNHRVDFNLKKLDTCIGPYTTIIYAHFIFSINGIIKKKIARHNLKLIEELADALHTRVYKELIFLSHLLAPTLQDIQQASTQNQEPSDLVKGLQKAEQIIHRLIAEDHNARIIRVPFIGHKPKQPFQKARAEVITINKLVASLITELNTTTQEPVTKIAGYKTDNTTVLSELNSKELDFFSPSILERLDKIFSKNDDIT